MPLTSTPSSPSKLSQNPKLATLPLDLFVAGRQITTLGNALYCGGTYGFLSVTGSFSATTDCNCTLPYTLSVTATSIECI